MQNELNYEHNVAVHKNTVWVDYMFLMSLWVYWMSLGLI